MIFPLARYTMYSITKLHLVVMYKLCGKLTKTEKLGKGRQNHCKI